GKSGRKFKADWNELLVLVWLYTILFDGMAQAMNNLKNSMKILILWVKVKVKLEEPVSNDITWEEPNAESTRKMELIREQIKNQLPDRL
ncbi:hypothetical protein HN51_066565, partial [Arachis hypogaea]